MTAYLLDVNVLIALLDPSHVQHDIAHDWFAATGHKAWASCPITENGVLRIIGNPRYPNSPGSPAAVVPLLAGLCALPGHIHWADDISVLDTAAFDATRLLAFRQITDSYLLALARAHKGQLATLDQRLVTDAVIGGKKSLHRIGID